MRAAPTMACVVDLDADGDDDLVLSNEREYWVRTFAGPARAYRRWAGINWIVHPRLTGTGTATEKCYLFHRNAIGHAVDKANIQSPVGYDEEQDYSYARCTVYMGSKILQPNGAGVIRMNHDGSAYVTS